MTRRSLALLGAVAAVAFTTQIAHADVSYSLVFGQDKYYVAPGGTVNVDVFLEGPESPINDPHPNSGETGVQWANVAVTRDMSSSTAAFIDSVDWNPAFDSSFANSISGGALDAIVARDVAPYPLIQAGQLYLFTLSIMAPIDAADHETTPFIVSLVTFDEGGADLLFLGSDEFLSTIATIEDGSTTIEIIPEPATVVLAAAGLMLMASRRRPSR